MCKKRCFKKGKWALGNIHISQKLVLRTKHFVRGKITDSFRINPDPDLSYLEKESTNQFLLLSLSRYSNSANMPIHSTLINQIYFHLLQPKVYCSKFEIAFTSIIPYLATDFDTVYTIHENFSGCSFTKKALS